MRIPACFFVLIPALLSCAGCGGKSLSLPGETFYTVSCDNDLSDCRAGAQTLCGGPYETVSGAEDRKSVGEFGWVNVDGEQSDVGSGGGRYSLRIRCKPQP